jgi:hypothetical protein
MKTDRKLWAAIVLLIVLITWLLIISINRKESPETQKSINDLKQQVEELINKSKEQSYVPADGKTPVLGVDYFNGQNGKTPVLGVDYFNGKNGDTIVGPKGDSVQGPKGDSTYDLAVKDGFQGTLKEYLNSLKGTPGSEIDIDCQDNHIAKKRTTDVFWQLTNIKCEVDNG